MRLRQLTLYLLKHRIKTAVLVFLVAFLPVFGMFGILLAALVTLTKGSLEGGLLTLLASLPYLITPFFPNFKAALSLPLALWAAVGVAILSNILTWIFAIMLRRGNNWSTILQVSALLGVLAISVVHLAFPDIVNWWGGQLQTYYNNTVATGIWKNSPTLVSPESRAESINFTKQYATGLIVAGILFNGLLQLIIARWWQIFTFRPISNMLKKELHSIRYSHLAGVLFLASLILAYQGNQVVLDMMPVLFLLFSTAGLSVLHAMFSHFQSSTTWFWLALLYLLLIFAIPTSLIIISLISLLDIWFDFRKRLKST